ncbi:DUF2127 domain-containing protein [Candidatus Kaiserbacteria bacterium]|nr:DUF2127 domain-containing protein [Candidatus Kaiserbacteria bacterium]
MNIEDVFTPQDENRLDTIDRLFRIGMWWRIAYGSLRLFLGLILFQLVGTPILDIFNKVMGHEIIEDPSDILMYVLSPLFQHLPFTVTYFVALYLILWGIIDIFLSVNLLREKMWAFPVSLYLIGIFICYEIYRFFHTHSLVLAIVIVIDCVLIWLIAKEYFRLKPAATTY